MSQLHLFRVKIPAATIPRPPNPDFIRKHLNRILRQLFAAHFLPWQEREAQSWIERFPRLASNNLPADEASAMIAMFDQQIARLSQATRSHAATRGSKANSG